MRSSRARSAATSSRRVGGQTAAGRTRSGPSPARWGSCPAPTARACSPAARPRCSPSPPWARWARSSAWTVWSRRRPSASSITTTSLPSPWARCAAWAPPAAARWATASWPSAPWSRSSPARRTSPTPSAWCRRCFPATAARSMASVCGSTLSLMDAGVPIKAPVAGVAMGLIMGDGDRYAILTDIAGLEDAMGDMDFKVAGTAEGITALQMDIKVKGITLEILEKALAQARQARLFILDRMLETIPASRPELSRYAPRMYRIQIPQEKIGMVIGPGGRVIRSIIEETKCSIDVEDDGTVLIGSIRRGDGPAGHLHHRGADQGSDGGRDLHRQGDPPHLLRGLRGDPARQGGPGPPARPGRVSGRPARRSGAGGRRGHGDGHRSGPHGTHQPVPPSGDGGGAAAIRRGAAAAGGRWASRRSQRPLSRPRRLRRPPARRLRRPPARRLRPRRRGLAAAGREATARRGGRRPPPGGRPAQGRPRDDRRGGGRSEPPSGPPGPPPPPRPPLGRRW